MDRLEDVSRVDGAMKLLQNILDKKFICHASGNESVPFYNGHHFYYIVQAGIKPGNLISIHFYTSEIQQRDPADSKPSVKISDYLNF